MKFAEIARRVTQPFSAAACTCRSNLPLICLIAKWCTSPIWLPLKIIWWLRHYEIGAVMVAAGLYAAVYQGVPNLHLKSPQEVWYDKGALELRKDLERKTEESYYSWSEFQSPEMDDFERSIRYYQDQQQANLWDRLLYGRPDASLAAQAYLKMGVIWMMISQDANDQKNMAMARSYLEKAVALNPGIPYARELMAGVPRVDTLALEALAPERDLEMMLQNNPQQRSKPSDHSKDGQKNKNGQGQNKKPGNQNQKGNGQQPQPKPGDKQQGKPNQKKPAPSSMNQMLLQNLQDVQNGTGNDGI